VGNAGDTDTLSDEALTDFDPSSRLRHSGLTRTDPVFQVLVSDLDQGLDVVAVQAADAQQAMGCGATGAWQCLDCRDSDDRHKQLAGEAHKNRRINHFHHVERRERADDGAVVEKNGHLFTIGKCDEDFPEDKPLPLNRGFETQETGSAKLDQRREILA